MAARRKGFITPELATEYLAGAVLLGAALATTVGVLTEVPVMLALCWFALLLGEDLMITGGSRIQQENRMKSLNMLSVK